MDTKQFETEIIVGLRFCQNSSRELAELKLWTLSSLGYEDGEGVVAELKDGTTFEVKIEKVA